MIKLEKDEAAPLAVVYGRSHVAHAVAQSLKKQHLRVILIQEATEALSVLEKAAYIFFFSENQSFDEALQSASKHGAKLVLVLDNADESIEKILLSRQQKHSWPMAVVEIKGEVVKTNTEAVEAAAGKIIRCAFHSSNSRQVILGQERVFSPQVVSRPQRAVSAQDVFNQLKKLEKKKPFPIKKFILHIVFFGLLVFVLLPVMFLGWFSSMAVIHAKQAGDDLMRGQFLKAETNARRAKSDIRQTKQSLQIVGAATFGLIQPLDKYFQMLVVGEAAIDLLDRAASLGPLLSEVAEGALSGRAINVSALAKGLKQGLGPINENLAIIEAASGNLMFHFPYIDKLPTLRSSLSQLDKLTDAWPEVIPAQGKKTYLLVFQNSAELRPTGGFIGSYGLVNFDSGRLVNWQIYDIYTADGQLKGHINPPDEILHFLGQPSWYMRDANWAADFPLTAKRLLWFLEKETGQKADGVVAVNLGAVQKLLKATGPLTLSELETTVSESDFFQKAEYFSEINFFAGSTQKRDFLGATAKALMGELTLNPQMAWAILSALEEKDLMLYFESPAVQSAMTRTNWSGTLELDQCQLKNIDCFMLVEANMGANKANYFVKRSLRVDSIISKGGDIDTTIRVRYQNNSPSEAWPGGRYKNYLRFLVLKGAKLTAFDLGDGRKPLLSPILTAPEMEKTTSDQFFVFQSTENSFTSFGTLVEVPIQSEKIISLTFRSPTKVSLLASKFDFTQIFIKQPGTNADLVDFALEFPSFLKPDKNLDKSQRLVYNSDLRTDSKFEVSFVNTFR